MQAGIGAVREKTRLSPSHLAYLSRLSHETTVTETRMLRPIYRFMIRRFGKRYNYDVGYMLFLLEQTPGLMNAFLGLSKLSGYREVAPLEAVMTARILGAMSEDCGPCLQLTVDMAREAGMADPLIESVLSGDVTSLCADSALGFRFAGSLLERSIDMGAARQAVVEAYGEAGVIELTLATQLTRVFPMLKRGLGYAESCSRVAVGNKQLGVLQEPV